jgi:hypothetical protein
MNGFESGTTTTVLQSTQRPFRPAKIERTRISRPHFGQKKKIGIEWEHCGKRTNVIGRPLRKSHSIANEMPQCKSTRASRSDQLLFIDYVTSGRNGKGGDSLRAMPFGQPAE